MIKLDADTLRIHLPQTVILYDKDRLLSFLSFFRIPKEVLQHISNYAFAGRGKIRLTLRKAVFVLEDGTYVVVRTGRPETMFDIISTVIYETILQNIRRGDGKAILQILFFALDKRALLDFQIVLSVVFENTEKIEAHTYEDHLSLVFHTKSFSVEVVIERKLITPEAWSLIENILLYVPSLLAIETKAEKEEIKFFVPKCLISLIDSVSNQSYLCIGEKAVLLCDSIIVAYPEYRHGKYYVAPAQMFGTASFFSNELSGIITKDRRIILEIQFNTLKLVLRSTVGRALVPKIKGRKVGEISNVVFDSTVIGFFNTIAVLGKSSALIFRTKPFNVSFIIEGSPMIYIEHADIIEDSQYIVFVCEGYLGISNEKTKFSIVVPNHKKYAINTAKYFSVAFPITTVEPEILPRDQRVPLEEIKRFFAYGAYRFVGEKYDSPERATVKWLEASGFPRTSEGYLLKNKNGILLLFPFS